MVFQVYKMRPRLRVSCITQHITLAIFQNLVPLSLLAMQFPRSFWGFLGCQDDLFQGMPAVTCHPYGYFMEKAGDLSLFRAGGGYKKTLTASGRSPFLYDVFHRHPVVILFQFDAESIFPNNMPCPQFPV